MSRRHRAKVTKLNRNFNQRKALIRSLVNSLIQYGEIETTLSRARLTKSLFDKIASRAKTKSLSSLRQTGSKIANFPNALKLTESILPIMGDRVSGFTRITRLHSRRGDGATVVRLELVSKPVETKPLSQPKPKKDTKILPKKKDDK